MRVPAVIRWPGHIKPGTVFNDIFASYDWLPTFVEIAGGPKGNDLNKQIKAGKYPGIVKTMLSGVNQLDYLTGKSPKSARDTFFYYGGPVPSAVRYKNWKIYFAMASEARPVACWGSIPSIGRWSTTSSGILSRRRSVSNRRPSWARVAHLADQLPPTSTTGTSFLSARRSGYRSLKATGRTRRSSPRSPTVWPKFSRR